MGWSGTSCQTHLFLMIIREFSILSLTFYINEPKMLNYTDYNSLYVFPSFSEGNIPLKLDFNFKINTLSIYLKFIFQLVSFKQNEI